jgi:hypothetical protein
MTHRHVPGSGKELIVKVKVFSHSTSKKGSLQDLEDQINAWLSSNPGVRPKFAEKLAHPTFGWGHIVLSVWYEEA